jgi:hypothetical protein
LGVLLKALEALGPDSLVVDAYGGRARVSGPTFDPSRVDEARATIEAVGGALRVDRWSTDGTDAAALDPASGSEGSAGQLDLAQRLEKIFDPEAVLWPCRA